MEAGWGQKFLEVYYLGARVEGGEGSSVAKLPGETSREAELPNILP